MSDEETSPRLIAAKNQERTFNGSPCAKGHSGLRYTSTGGCVVCSKDSASERQDRIRKLLRGESA